MYEEPTAETAYRKAGAASLVATGRVYTVRLNRAVQASLQVGAFKADVDARTRSVQLGILQSLELGRFHRTRLPGGEAAYEGTLPAQVVYVYFPPSGRYYDLLVAQQAFADAALVFANLIAYQGDGP